jgi:hypothetical protein
MAAIVADRRDQLNHEDRWEERIVGVVGGDASGGVV